MSNGQNSHVPSRRAVVASLGAGGLGLALAARSGVAIAQDNSGDLAGHPLVGTWLVMTPGAVVPQSHGPDGSILAAFPPNYVDPILGLTFQGVALGRWESTGARSGRFTFIQALSDDAGAYIGTWQLAGYLEASEDGQSWVGGQIPSRVIVRDAGNTVIFDEEEPVDQPVTATRVGATAESVVLPATPAAATPAT
jgi:hypothetical protein